MIDEVACKRRRRMDALIVTCSTAKVVSAVAAAATLAGAAPEDGGAEGAWAKAVLASNEADADISIVLSTRPHDTAPAARPGSPD